MSNIRQFPTSRKAAPTSRPNNDGRASVRADQQHPADDRILRIVEVCALTGLSRTTIWRRTRDGSFPPSIPLGPEGTRAKGWRHSSIQAWIAGLPEAAYHHPSDNNPERIPPRAGSPRSPAHPENRPHRATQDPVSEEGKNHPGNGFANSRPPFRAARAAGPDRAETATRHLQPASEARRSPFRGHLVPCLYLPGPDPVEHRPSQSADPVSGRYQPAGLRPLRSPPGHGFAERTPASTHGSTPARITAGRTEPEAGVGYGRSRASLLRVWLSTSSAWTTRRHADSSQYRFDDLPVGGSNVVEVETSDVDLGEATVGGRRISLLCCLRSWRAGRAARGCLLVPTTPQPGELHPNQHPRTSGRSARRRLRWGRGHLRTPSERRSSPNTGCG